MVKWSERYNCHMARLPGGLLLNVNWSTSGESGYVVYVFGKPIGVYKNITEGKRAAISTAREILKKALEALPE
jgi:hypothetical protein